MTTSDQNQPQGADQTRGEATDAAHAPQPDAGGERAQQRHGRRRHGGRSERRPAQQQQRRADSTLNMEELRELTELFSAHGLTDFEFENADIRIRLSRNPAPTSAVAAATPVVLPASAITPLAAIQSAGTGAQPETHTPATEAHATTTGATTEAAPEEELHIIPSPIVGTFYRSPSPNADPFVKVGSHVDNDTVVCIIEAMKLMNEIQAETAGTVAKIYVENGQPVEYGQPLFGVKK